MTYNTPTNADLIAKGMSRNDVNLLWDHNMEAAFDFLDMLRESGVTNMFGARPYLVEEFIISKTVAGVLLSLWMETFEARQNSIKEGTK